MLIGMQTFRTKTA